MGVFLVTNIVIGYALNGIHDDIKETQHFLDLAKDVKPNFERSLTLYTEGAEDAILNVKTLRPDSETEYIKFISSVEEIGDELSLDLELESLGKTAEKSGFGNTLNYKIRFYGGQNEMLKFLTELEALPYYLRVDTLHFETLELVKNIDLTVSLYVQ